MQGQNITSFKMSKRIINKALLAVAVLMGLTACATTTVENKKPSAELVWPRPPEQPRISYIESLSRSYDVEGKPSFLENLIDEVPVVRGLSQPYSVAVDGKGRVYTVDQPLLKVFDKTGKKYSEISSLDKIKMLAPLGVTIAPDETIFVSDTILKAVMRFDQSRKLLLIIGGDDGCGESIFERPTGLAVDRANNRLYIVDTKKHQVFAYDLKGQYLFTIGERAMNRETLIIRPT